MTKTIQNKVMDIAELARWVVMGFLALTSIMWILNITGAKEVNAVFGLVGLIAVIFVAIKPNIIGSSMILGGIFAFLNDQDKTQGVAKGPLWLYRLVMVVLYGFLLLSIILASWSFKENPFAFWALFLVIVALVAWQQVYGSNSKWGRKIPYFYLLACAIVLIWSTFSGSWRGEAFDKCNGNPLYLVDPMTGNKHGEVAATDCENPKFSPETGKPLRAMTADEAIRRNPLTAPGAYVSDAGKGVKAAVTTVGSGSGKVVTTSCRAPVSASAKKRPEPVLSLNCTQKVYVARDLNPEFMALDSRFDGPVGKYFDINWITSNAIEVTPKKDAWPIGPTETVNMAIMSAKEAAPLKPAAK